MKDTIEELADLLYVKLMDSENNELTFDEIIDILSSKSEFGFRKVEGRGIRLLKEKYKNVTQLRDEKGRPYLIIEK